MKPSRIFFFSFIFLLLIQSAFSFGKKDKDSDTKENETQKEEKLPDETIKIDLFLDTKKPNPKNHFIWHALSKSSASTSSPNSDNSYKDYFDTISGASKVHSTKNFREFSADSNSKNLRTPKGLRNLCLYAVSNPEMLSTDNFSVTQQGKKLTITFTHREISYKIETDEKGILTPPEGFFIKLKETTDSNSESEKKADEGKKQGEEKKDGEKAQPENPEPEFQKDEPQESLSAIFKGKLTAALSPEGILTLKGKLKLTKKEKPEEPKKESEEEKSEEEKPEDEKESPAEEAPQD